MKILSKSSILISILLLITVQVSLAQQTAPPKILSMQERANVMNNWLEYRLENVVPKLMQRENIDMWIIIAREYNEDPVIKTMLPATWQTARRRTILVFSDNGKEVDRLAIARYDIGKFFKTAWNKDEEPNQWKRLIDIIKERDPNNIALNYSSTFALADGISHSEYEAFTSALPKHYQSRIVSGENLAIGWLETRTEPEMEVYPMICHIAHDIIAEGFSEKVIQPGITTTKDVE